MSLLSGGRLSALAAGLMALAAAAAVRVALSGDLRMPSGETHRTAGAPEAASEEHLAFARASEARGDLTSALSHYRAAATLSPRCVDPRSPHFLGKDFEKKVKAWVAGLRKGEIAAGPSALPDASYLFRRMYGGCG